MLNRNDYFFIVPIKSSDRSSRVLSAFLLAYLYCILFYLFWVKKKIKNTSLKYKKERIQSPPHHIPFIYCVAEWI